MKIGIYDPYLDDLGGGEKYMMTIAQYLAKEHDVTVFWDNKEDIESLKKRFSLDLDTIRLHKNIFSSSVGFKERAVITKAYDALIILSDGSIPLVLSRKLFIHIQQPLLRKSPSLKEQLKIARVTKFFYNSKFTMDCNKHIFPENKSVVLYPPVSINKKRVTKENIILHVGRFRVRNIDNSDFKKQWLMVDAFRSMIEQGLKNWRFVIAASVKKEDEDSFAALEKNAKNFPIKFLVNKSNDQLWEIYNKAKIYWHASGFGEDLSAHPELAEHFGISTVEAMGAGAVPVVINAGGQKEIITDGQNGLLWDTLDELKAKTNLLVHDKVLLTKLSEGAKERAKDFSKEKFDEQVKQLILGR